MHNGRQHTRHGMLTHEAIRSAERLWVGFGAMCYERVMMDEVGVMMQQSCDGFVGGGKRLRRRQQHCWLSV